MIIRGTDAVFLLVRRDAITIVARCRTHSFLWDKGYESRLAGDENGDDNEDGGLRTSSRCNLP